MNTTSFSLATIREHAAQAFLRQRNPQHFFQAYLAAIDPLISQIFQSFNDLHDCCLLATGGYGRGELYPFSDLDLALILPDQPSEAHQQTAAAFQQKLWDIGLQPALISGTVSQLAQAAQHDLARDTAFLEARLLTGQSVLQQQLNPILNNQRDTVAFIEGKLLEMRQRHNKGQGSDNLLEPNIKNGTGGLRDLHTIFWLAKVQGIDHTRQNLLERHILTHTEWGVLQHSHRQLARIRIALHLCAGRATERLVFDYQLQVASLLGWHHPDPQQRSEQLMRHFYRATKAVKQLNGILLPMLRGRVYAPIPRTVQHIDHNYYQVGNQLAVKDKTLFQRDPSQIFHILTLWQQHRHLDGLAPQTLRAWWQAAQQHINTDFYAQADNRRRFVQLFQTAHGLTHILRFLNLYGVLGLYLPNWQAIVGLLQHDLFHVYPVDDHILAVLRNLRRFALPAHNHEFPTASELMANHPQPHILYLAALLHDIAKGRGGDHAILGAADARQFARDHFLTPDETNLLAWLVEHHLDFSHTAQKEDIQNPDTITRFAAHIGNTQRLHALYLLTIADIRGTNPKIWNDWKAGLIDTLLHATQAHLSGQRHSPEQRRQQALDHLAAQNIDPATSHKLLNQLGAAYLSRHDNQQIQSHLHHLAQNPKQAQAHVQALGSNSLQAWIYLPDRHGLFAQLCRLFARHRLPILSANAYLCHNQHILDTFVLQLPPNSQAHDSHRLQQQLQTALTQFIQQPQAIEPTLPRQTPRRQKHLPFPPIINLDKEEKSEQHTLEIIAADRPHLLADIAQILSENHINLSHARITTLDERVEDSFRISHPQLSDTAFQLQLKQQLHDKLNTA